MWNQSRIVGPLHIPASRDSAGNVIAWVPGYHLLIDPAAVSEAALPFQASYTESPIVFAGTSPVYLTFADEAEARATIPELWVEEGEEPADIVPQRVTRRQMKLTLNALGKLEQIEGFVATQSAEVQISWNEASEFYRSDAMINAMAPMLEMTSEDLDNLFRAAAQVQ